MFINTLNCSFFFVCTKKDKTFTNLENNVKCYCLLKEWEREKTGKNNMVYNIVPLFNCRLVMHTHNTKVFHDTHTLKSSFETYKNALKNMYIDIFICIQIGPSQQKQTHIPFICLSFAKGGFLTETDVSIKSADDSLICSRTPYIKVKSPGRENH